MLERFNTFTAPAFTIMAILNAALAGNGTVTITASKRGIRAKLARGSKPFASGATPSEFHQAFTTAREAALAAPTVNFKPATANREPRTPKPRPKAPKTPKSRSRP
jgi:hypothetical protein